MGDKSRMEEKVDERQRFGGQRGNLNSEMAMKR